MTLSEILLPEFEEEVLSTRQTLERVPADKFGWKPHDKSMTMVQLATLVAELPSWAAYTIGQDSLDIAPKDGPGYQSPKVNSTQDLLAIFDQSVASARAAMRGATDEHLLKPWSLLAGGNVIFTLPRYNVLRRTVINHLVHHRAQLGVFLRLNNIPLPAIYGPSADEGGM
ncbi:MAG TPA: damage-inducible protein DinB [Terriglobia bacterium]|nr:damage-inducible protein DinB [Terriglobia bacterium]